MRDRTAVLSGLLCLSTTACLVFFGTLTAHAEDSLPGGAFVVRPAKVELSIPPGEKRTTEIKLANGGGAPLHVEVSFEYVGASPQSTPSDEPIKLLGRDGGTYELTQFFHTPKTSFDILSGKEVSVPITVSIPRDAEPRGVYGAAVFTFHPAFDAAEKRDANIAVESRVATLYFVRIEGGVREEGKLAQFGLFNNVRTTLSPSEGKPLRFQVAYENTGNVHLNPYGKLSITPLVGDAQEVLIDPWAVLPGATRMREVDLGKPLSLGRYTAHIELNRGYQDIVDEQEVVFWVVPGPEGTVLIIALLLAFVYIIRRSLSLSRHSTSS